MTLKMAYPPKKYNKTIKWIKMDQNKKWTSNNKIVIMRAYLVPNHSQSHAGMTWKAASWAFLRSIRWSPPVSSLRCSTPSTWLEKGNSFWLPWPCLGVKPQIHTALTTLIKFLCSQNSSKHRHRCICPCVLYGNSPLGRVGTPSRSRNSPSTSQK